MSERSMRGSLKISKSIQFNTVAEDIAIHSNERSTYRTSHLEWCWNRRRSRIFVQVFVLGGGGLKNLLYIKNLRKTSSRN